MNKRGSERWHRRFRVRFWAEGNSTAQWGYTQDMSFGGMYVETSHVLSRGTRIRMEVLDSRYSFILEGLVVRTFTVPVHLQRVRQAGMGIRFLRVEELVRSLIPEMGDIPPAPAAPPEEPVAEWAELPPEPSRPATPTGKPRIQAKKHREYELRYPGRKAFAAAWERDIATGGLFVPTSNPGRIDEQIVVKISIRGSDAAPIRVRGKIVHRIDPSMPGLEGRNLMAGMGVEILDLDEALADLAPLKGA